MTATKDHHVAPAGRAAPQLPRGRRSLAAVVVAVMLLAVSAYVGWQAILVQLREQPYPLDAAAISESLNQTPWSHGAVIAVGVVAVLLGLWLLATAVIPGRRILVELHEPHPDVATGIHPTDLRRAVDGAAERIDGISTARTVLSRGTAITTVSTPLGNPAALTDKVTAAVTEQLTQLDPVDPLVSRVRLTGKDR